MTMTVDNVDRAELQQKLRPSIEKPIGPPSKRAWVNLITVKAWPSGEQMRDQPVIFQEEIREVSAKPSASMPQLTKPISKLIEEMALAMEATASQIGGMIRFHVEMFIPGSDKSVFNHFSTLYGDNTNTHDMDAPFPGGQLGGTERGDKAADLRHREQMFRLMRDGNKTIIETQQEMIAELRTRVKEQDAFIVRMHAATEQAQSQALQRDITLKTANKKEEMLMQAFSAFMGHLPIIAQYFTGGGNATINLGQDTKLQALKAVYAGLPLEIKQDLEMKVIDLMSKIQPAHQNVMMQVFADLKKTEQAENVALATKNGGSLPSGFGASGRALTEGGL